MITEEKPNHLELPIFYYYCYYSLCYERRSSVWKSERTTFGTKSPHLSEPGLFCFCYCAAYTSFREVMVPLPPTSPSLGLEKCQLLMWFPGIKYGLLEFCCKYFYPLSQLTHTHFLVCCLKQFWCSPGWPQTRYVAKGNLEL